MASTTKISVTLNPQKVADKELLDFVFEKEEEGIKRATLIRKALQLYMETEARNRNVIPSSQAQPTEPVKSEFVAQSVPAQSLETPTRKQKPKEETESLSGEELLLNKNFIGFSLGDDDDDDED